METAAGEGGVLRLYRGNRLEYLSDLIGHLLAREPLSDPFACEQILVPHPGVGQWLSLRLADAAGICANVRFPLPAGFIWEQFRHLLTDVPEQDRYAPDTLRWSLFQELERAVEEPLFEPLQPFLQAQGMAGRFDLADRLAHLFDQYLVYRPDWILHWEGGRSAVPGDDWQAELWRRLVARLGDGHWVRQQQRLFLAAEQGRLDPERLPQRISLFGIGALSPGYLETLVLLSRWIDVHLFLLDPCRTEWMGLVTAATRERRGQQAPAEAPYLEVGNPLLASLGRRGREFLAQLQAHDPGSVELFHPAPGEGLLASLQRDILELRDPTAGPPSTLAGEDDSIRILSCHGPQRELEVLHDQLLDLFERDPRLQPDDVLVMTPDMELYAPYIEAVFGASGGDRRIPFHLGDRPGGAGQPLVAAFMALLELPAGRFEVDRLLQLLEVPAIQRRFGLGDGDLTPIMAWLREAGIRWGWDAAARQQEGMPAQAQNTWRQGLDRLLLGMALPTGGERLFGGLLPAGGVEGADVRLLGALGEFAGTLSDWSRRLQQDRPMAAWHDRLLALLADLFAPDEQEEFQLQRIREAIAAVVTEAEAAGTGAAVPLELIRRILQPRLDEGGGGFLRGGVTFCALVPGHSLPFPVVCLLGMNDGSFPREQRPSGFDLMSRGRRLGDRDRRDDDRYLFLEALLSARRCLIISYSGQDPRENTELPPSTLVSELLDYLGQGYLLPSGEPVTDRLPQRHPLQPFDHRYFDGRSGLFSYSTTMAQAAQRALSPDRRERSFLAAPLEQPGDEWRSLDLEELGRFFANPVRYLLRRRLGLELEGVAEELESRDPFQLDREDERRVGERLLTGLPLAQVRELERAAGRLPHGAQGEALLARARESIRPLARRLQEQDLFPGDEWREFRLQIGDFILSGRLQRLRPEGIRGFTPLQLPASRLFRLWLRHLVLNAVRPEGIATETRWLQCEGVVRFPPLDDAPARLEQLLACYWDGLVRPLHLFPRSSLEFARGVQQGKEREQALKRARQCWAGEYARWPESADPHYAVAFGDRDVLDQAFMHLSEACFGPLLAAMEEG